MSKTKLDMNDKAHQLLVGTLSLFVDDFGYTTRELFELMEDCKRQLWHALVEMEKEKAHEE